MSQVRIAEYLGVHDVEDYYYVLEPPRTRES